jgi:hypothetical protein
VRQVEPGTRDHRNTAATTGTFTQRFWFPEILAVVRRPRLWPTAWRQWLRMIPRRWWRRPPFLPVPDRAYVRFRIETAYGHEWRKAPRGAATDLVTYLEWCRASDRMHR